MNHLQAPKEEIIRILEVFQMELKTSEFSRAETKEIKWDNRLAEQNEEERS